MPIANATRQSFYQMEQVRKMQSSRKFFIRESFQTPHSYYNKKNPIRKDFFENLFTFHGKYDKIIYVTENHAKNKHQA